MWMPRLLPVLVVTAFLSACGASEPAPPSETDATTDVAPDAGPDVAADGGADVAIDPCAVDVDLANPPTPSLHTPRWAFEPWISKDISTADDTRAFVQGFIDRDIPVGVVVLDSPWETNYHTFVPNPSRYPDFDKLVGELHGKNVKIVVWMTAMMNESSYDLEATGDTYPGPAPKLAEGLACGHFVNAGELNGWWKGNGAAIDFWSPAARTWWNRQQLDILKLVDGYKLDFGEMYITTVPMQTAAGKQDLDAYSRAYYHQMLAFGRQQKGAEFLTMVRPWDESYGFPGRFFADIQDAPVAWVGDNRRDWVGMADALNEIFISAAKGYTMLGSDLGGYLDRNDLSLTELVPWNHVTFARWTALGALGPFMQLHGRANLTPWTTPDHTDELLAAYKYWASWHHALAPTLAAVTQRSQTVKGAPLVTQPVGDQGTWAGDWRYILAGRWLVAPLTDDSGARQVLLPAGRSWINWWLRMDTPMPGGQSISVDFHADLTGFPLWLDACSVQPYTDGRVLTGLAPDGLVAPDAWWLVAASGCETGEQAQFLGAGQTTSTAQDDVQATVTQQPNSGTVTVTTAAATGTSQLFAVLLRDAPASVQYAGKDVPHVTSLAGKTTGWFHDAVLGTTWVRVAAAVAGGELVLGE